MSGRVRAPITLDKIRWPLGMAYPMIGSLPVSKISPQEVLADLRGALMRPILCRSASPWGPGASNQRFGRVVKITDFNVDPIAPLSPGGKDDGASRIAERVSRSVKSAVCPSSILFRKAEGAGCQTL